MSEELLSPTLSASERKEFAECNRVITEGLPSVWSVGNALRRVRDARLYREDFSSFQEYSESKWQLSLGHAKRLMAASEVKEDLDERAPKLAELVVNEAQARELAKYPEDERTTVLRELKKTGEPVTAEAIRAFGDTPKSGNGKANTTANIASNVAPTGAISEKHGVSKPADPVDETGVKLTSTALKSWAHRDLVQGWLSALIKIKSEFSVLKEDPLFIRRQQQITAALTQAYTALTDVKPHAVCVQCAGYPEKVKFCTYCGTSGVMSRYAYEQELKTNDTQTIAKLARRNAA